MPRSHGPHWDAGQEAEVTTVSLDSVSRHALRRLAQRNLSLDDAAYVVAHGRIFHTGHARFVHLGLRDIPREDRRVDLIRRLEGTVLVFDSEHGDCLTTAYRNRERGMRDIRRKPKREFTYPKDLILDASSCRGDLPAGHHRGGSRPQQRS